eukprot:9493244-Pyramimonas_sp.AAC.1
MRVPSGPRERPMPSEAPRDGPRMPQDSPNGPRNFPKDIKKAPRRPSRFLQEPLKRTLRSEQ